MATFIKAYKQSRNVTKRDRVPVWVNTDKIAYMGIGENNEYYFVADFGPKVLCANEVFYTEPDEASKIKDID